MTQMSVRNNHYVDSGLKLERSQLAAHIYADLIFSQMT